MDETIPPELIQLPRGQLFEHGQNSVRYAMNPSLCVNPGIVNARRNTFFLLAVFSALTALTYTLLPISDVQMLMLGFPLGFFVSGYSRDRLSSW